MNYPQSETGLAASRPLTSDALPSSIFAVTLSLDPAEWHSDDAKEPYASCPMIPIASSTFQEVPGRLQLHWRKSIYMLSDSSCPRVRSSSVHKFLVGIPSSHIKPSCVVREECHHHALSPAVHNIHQPQLVTKQGDNMIHIFRVFLYFLLFVFSAVVMSLCAVRLHYTLNLSPSDPLNHGVKFYDPIIVELLVTSILSMLWSFLIGRTIHRRIERRFINTFATEIIGLFILFLLWIVGDAIATQTGNQPDPNTHWGNLSSCWVYSSCRVLTAMLAFAWVSWVVVLALLVTSILFASANKAFRDPLHGRWDRRATHYGPTPMRNLP